VGRFYGDGYTWATRLDLPALFRLSGLISEIARREHERR